MANKLSSSHTRRLAARSAVSTGDVTFDTSTLKVDATNDSVGIGTASPDAAQSLHVYGGDETTAKFEDSTGKSILLDGNSVIASSEMYMKVGSGKVLYFQDGSNTNAVINGSGNVGIGTLSPSVELDVAGAITSSGAVTGGSFTDGTATLSSGNLSSAATVTATTFTDSTATLTGGALSGGSSVSATTLTDTVASLSAGAVSGLTTIGSSGAATLDSGANGSSFGGSLGIGTLSPDMKLHVVGGDETTAKFEDSSGKYSLIDGNSFITSSEMYVKAGAGQSIYFQDGSSTNAIIDGSGNLGIGTLSPSVKLDVSGAIALSGNLTVDTDTLFADASTNRVGIGTTSPASALHVKTASSHASITLTRAEKATGEVGFNVEGGTGGKIWYLVQQSNSDDFTFWDSNGDAARLTLKSGGNVGIGNASPEVALDVGGSAIRIATSSAPSGKTAAGVQGEIRWDSGYIYVCVDTNTWKRAAIGDGGW